MASEKEISTLIRKLRDSTSLQDQLMTVVKGWRTVRGLTPAQRIQVATHVGLDEAESLLQRLGRPAGIAPARLLRALRKAQKASPNELREILQGLRDPSKRVEAARRGLDVVADVVDEAYQTPQTPVVGGAAKRPLPPPSPEKATVIKVGDLKVPKPPRRAEKATKPTPPRTTESVAPPRPDTDREEPGKSPKVSRRSEIAKKPSAPPEEPQPPKVAPPRVEQSSWDRLKSDLARFETAEKAEPRETRTQGLAAELTREPSLMRRFRRLRDALDSEESLGHPRRDLLLAFPEGWARRRVLQALIRSGRLPVDELPEALAALPNPRDEQWCIATLLRSGHAKASELENLAAQLRSRHGRRLLERELAAGRSRS